jgi:hypothetical protein
MESLNAPLSLTLNVHTLTYTLTHSQTLYNRYREQRDGEPGGGGAEVDVEQVLLQPEGVREAANGGGSHSIVRQDGVAR